MEGFWECDWLGEHLPALLSPRWLAYIRQGQASLSVQRSPSAHEHELLFTEGAGVQSSVAMGCWGAEAAVLRVSMGGGTRLQVRHGLWRRGLESMVEVRQAHLVWAPFSVCTLPP